MAIISNNILRLDVVSKKCGLSKPTIYRKVGDGTFPQPIKLGTRAIGWIEKDIEDWISNQLEPPKKSTSAGITLSPTEYEQLIEICDRIEDVFVERVTQIFHKIQQINERLERLEQLVNH